MDKAHLSRIFARLRARKLVRSRVSEAHGKHVLLFLTDAGSQAFAAADTGAKAQIDALLSPVDAAGRERLVKAMRDVRAVLGDRETQDGEPRLRSLAPGDIGWIVHRQTVLYHQEYGWDWTYEGLASRILGAFVAEFDPAREDGWVAERRGAIVGSIFLMKGDGPGVAKLRLLYAERARRWPRTQTRRHLHRAGARARLQTAYLVDQRRARLGVAHLSGGGVPPDQRGAAPFVRP
jgi:hypothetical protein